MARKKGYTAWCNCCDKKVHLTEDDTCPHCGTEDWEDYDGQDCLDNFEVIDMLESHY